MEKWDKHLQSFQSDYGKCKLCGQNDSVFNIFTTSYEQYSPISKIFEACMSSKIRREDAFLDLVCRPCLEEAIETLNLKKTWERSHSSLDKYFEILNKGSNWRASASLSAKAPDKPSSFPECFNGKFTCLICRKPFFSLEHLQAHMSSYLHRTRCRICHRECRQSDLLKKHYDEHKRNKLSLCPWCGGTVVDGFHNFDYKFVCPLCSFAYPCNLFLQNHMTTDHPSQECPNGSIVVIQNNGSEENDIEESLNAVEIHHIEYKCSECHKSFSSMAKLENHVSQLRCMYVCDVCGASYKLKTQLKIHVMDKHMGLKPHLCSLCGKRFVKRGMLKSHQQVHTKEKAFQCHECGKKFVSAATLRYHHRLHTGEKPYACAVCGQSFVKSSRLREHEQKQHIGKLQCPVCMTAFSQRCSLKTHMDRFHPNTYHRNHSYLMEAHPSQESLLP